MLSWGFSFCYFVEWPSCECLQHVSGTHISFSAVYVRWLGVRGCVASVGLVRPPLSYRSQIATICHSPRFSSAICEGMISDFPRQIYNILSSIFLFILQKSSQPPHPLPLHLFDIKLIVCVEVMRSFL